MSAPDIDPASGSRLPLPRREDLDDLGKGIYDIVADPAGITLRGLRGPGGIYLHSSQFAALMRPLNNYLRNGTGLSAHVREVAILAAARAADSQFEWIPHEKEALKEGVPTAVIDVIKYRKPTTGLDETDAIVIDLCRESFVQRKLSSELYARALKRFGTKHLVDLVGLMGYYTMMAGMLTAFDMQLDPGQEPQLPVP
jgi:4-carboxymuconolactone decarboxylase